MILYIETCSNTVFCGLFYKNSGEDGSSEIYFWKEEGHCSGSIPFWAKKAVIHRSNPIPEQPDHRILFCVLILKARIYFSPTIDTL